MVAEFDQPMTTATVIEVDTTGPIAIDALATRVTTLLAALDPAADDR